MCVGNLPAFIYLRALIVQIAVGYVGQGEVPPGSNRGPFVDETNRMFGSPLGSKWCANFAGRVFKEAGAKHPTRETGSVDTWIRWAIREGLWRDVGRYTPMAGDLVVYGRIGDGNHIGIVVESTPGKVLTVEGNQRHAVRKVTNSRRRVIGYIALEKVLPLGDPNRTTNKGAS